jgi:hypothetical protein
MPQKYYFAPLFARGVMTTAFSRDTTPRSGLSGRKPLATTLRDLERSVVCLDETSPEDVETQSVSERGSEVWRGRSRSGCAMLEPPWRPAASQTLMMGSSRQRMAMTIPAPFAAREPAGLSARRTGLRGSWCADARSRLVFWGLGPLGDALPRIALRAHLGKLGA